MIEKRFIVWTESEEQPLSFTRRGYRFEGCPESVHKLCAEGLHFVLPQEAGPRCRLLGDREWQFEAFRRCRQFVVIVREVTE